MKILKVFGILIVLAVLAGWLLWPKNLVVNGPVLDFILGRQIDTPSAQKIQTRFKLPDGFKIGVFAANVPNARTIAVAPTGDVIAASMRPGEIILLYADRDGDGASDGRDILLSELDNPHGVALHEGYLYIAETQTITRYPYDAEKRALGTRELVFQGLPAGGNHRTRSLDIGPDGALYVTTGSSCNVCIEEQPYRATMLRMSLTGADAGVYATGLRNSVGFDWHPVTSALYATDNGRDLLGDDTPNCELNRIEKGSDYGWPYAYDDRVPDPDFGLENMHKVNSSKAPVHGFGAHRAPLGIHFLNPYLDQPAGYENAALVALHGSWNRSKLAGYKVVSLHFNLDGTIEERDFLSGFEEEEDVIGRPVEIAQGPDGGIYISDDYSGTIYKVGWGAIMVPGFAVASSDVGASDPLAAYSADQLEEKITEGYQLYGTYGCASCHDPQQAPDGAAVKELKNLSARFDVAALKALLKSPPGPMPVFDLSDSEREALAVYLLSWKK